MRFSSRGRRGPGEREREGEGERQKEEWLLLLQGGDVHPSGSALASESRFPTAAGGRRKPLQFSGLLLGGGVAEVCARS